MITWVAFNMIVLFACCIGMSICNKFHLVLSGLIVEKYSNTTVMWDTNGYFSKENVYIQIKKDIGIKTSMRQGLG